MLISIRDYAIYKNITVQTVYTHIKKDLLNIVIKDGKKFLKVDKEEIEVGNEDSFKATLKPFKESLNSFKDILKPFKKQIKKQEVTIERLNSKIEEKDKTISKLYKKLEKCSKSKEKVLLSYIQEMKQLQIGHKANDVIIDDVIDIKEKKKKKGKGKKK